MSVTPHTGAYYCLLFEDVNMKIVEICTKWVKALTFEQPVIELFHSFSLMHIQQQSWLNSY